MPDVFLIIVLLLFGLAIMDLVVGVSNDAVNFLNSAIGSKVAPRYLIMTVASLGIFVGATFSSGMMEVARKGIFNPEYFYFNEIMILFLAVMLTDIILLDVFNTFGMPTSTTVSIVFELLGASVILATIKVLQQGEGLSMVGEYINSTSALVIISGIFLSITIAFAIGAGVQKLSRLLFSFQYKKRLKWVGAIWSGLALSTLTYFLLMKGAKGASFLSPDFVQWVGNNTLMLLAGSFVIWAALMQILIYFFRVDVLRIVVLFGTFSLAMAFAGNDLVNFIGVPIAGLESFLHWNQSGVAAESLEMNILQESVRTPTYLLLLAGTIMILTLWFSRKARSVTETEVNLGRQDDGAERFRSNLLARGLVRISRTMGSGFQNLIPLRIRERAEQNFRPLEKTDEVNPPAFDMLRASVNLTTASMLIALATSLKLPLSTTYVSFMVAMGTSLADNAWGRDSAVFRVSGVLNVIGGWFLTAIIAFTVAGLFACLLYFLGAWAMGGLVLLAILLIRKTYLHHKTQSRAKAEQLKREEEVMTKLPEKTMTDMLSKIQELFNSINETYQNSIEGLLYEDRSFLKKAQKDMNRLWQQSQTFKQSIYRSIGKMKEKEAEGSRLLLIVYDLEQDLLQSMRLVVEMSNSYVDNSLSPLLPLQEESLLSLCRQLTHYLQDLGLHLSRGNSGLNKELQQRKNTLMGQIENHLSLQVQGIKQQKYGARNSELYFSLLLESKDIIAVATRFCKVLEKGNLYSKEKKVLLQKTAEVIAIQ